MPVAREFLGEVAGHLGHRLVGTQPDAHGHTRPLPDFPVQPFAPRLIVRALHPAETDETLVNGIPEICRRLGPDDGHHARSHFAVKLIVGREHGNLGLREKLSQPEIGRAGLDAQCLGLVAPRHHAAVVVRQHHHGFSLQIRTENPFATHIAVVAVNNAVHIYK